MALKVRLLVCMIALVAALPARADVLLGYRIGLPPSGNQADPTWIDPDDGTGNLDTPPALGAPITGPLMMTVGETTFLQLTIQANLTPLSSPTPNFPPTAWTNTNRLTNVGFILRYPLGVVDNPFALPIPPIDPDQNRANATAAIPFQTSNPPSFPSYNMGGTYLNGATSGAGIGTNPNPPGIVNERVIAVFRLVAGNSPGVGTITAHEVSVQPTDVGFALQMGQYLDEYIFHASHGDWPLPVIVGVPEPSSIVLVGLPIAMAAWRHRRRKQQCAV